MTSISSPLAVSAEPATENTPDIPLIVDLDGTLTHSDTLHEALLALLAKNPARMVQIPGWLSLGKAKFKERVADEALVDVTTLPLRKDVLALIDEAKAAGRKVLLVSASDQRQVTEIATHLGLFDEAIGTHDGRNLAGTEKARWLIDRFGEKGFDYVGDSSADLDVWPHARTAITVGLNEAKQSAVNAKNADSRHLNGDTLSSAEQLRAQIKAMRPHQWLKNLLVFVPALAAHNPSALLASFFAFVAFSLAASSIYIINDLLDLEVDRRHPRKCKRPFAAGTVSVKKGIIQSAGLFGIAILLAALVAPAFLAVLAGYVFLTFAYSLVLKRKLMIDIWTLASLYTIRIVAGGAASGVALSEWLLAFSMFIFLSLASVKRMSELADLKKRGEAEADGRGYRVSDLPVVLGAVLASGYCSVVILALYVSNESVAGLYSAPELLWLVCLMLLYWISRATIVSWRGEMDDDPIIFAIKDRVSLFIFACCAAVFVVSALL